MEIKEKQNFLINFGFIITWLVIIYFSLKFMLAYLFPFLIGIIISFAMQKPAAYISSKIKIKKEICAAILSVLVYVAIILFAFLFGWLLFSKINLLIDYISGQSSIFKEYAEKIYRFTENFSNYFDGGLKSTLEKMIGDTISSFRTKITAFLSNTVTSVVKNIPNFFVSTVVTVVATCYISKDYDRLKRFIMGLMKESTYKNAVVIKNIFTDCILKFILGYLLIMGITFVQLLIGFFILGIKNFLITAFLISLIDILPVLGIGTVLLPWSVILFLQGNYKLGFGIIILYIIISIVRNFVEPKIIGKQMGINPLFTLLFMFLGLKLAGVAGMIILPIVLIIVITFYKRQITATDK